MRSARRGSLPTRRFSLVRSALARVSEKVVRRTRASGWVRVTECHESRVDTAVARLAQVTGLDATDIRDQLLGLAQEFIDYEKLYRQALKDSETKSSEAEIAEGIQKAEEAFQLAYDTIFKHAVSPFNPDRFKQLMLQNLTLEDLQDRKSTRLNSSH